MRSTSEKSTNAMDERTNAMGAPLTPKPIRKAEDLARAPPTIASCREEDAALRNWPLPLIATVLLRGPANHNSQLSPDGNGVLVDLRTLRKHLFSHLFVIRRVLEL